MVLHPRVLLLASVFSAAYFLGLEASVCWKKPYCNCYQGDRPTIYCRYVRNVSDVLPLLMKHSPVYKIRLQGSFRTLPSGSPFDGISVSVLSLTAPVGQDLPEDALLGVRDLRTLILNGSAYGRVPEALVRGDAGRGLRSFLSVRGGLTALEDLQNLSSCAEIDLSRNRLSAVSRDAFVGSSKVQRLRLSRNRIAFLDPATFLPTPFLEELDLSHNRLHSVDGCFANLNPKTINLYANNLTSVDNVFHQDMWNLKYLNLGGNPGVRITSATFNASLKSLMELHLSDDGLDYLEPSMLKNVWNLHHLYLNNNNLSSVPRYFLEHTPFITTLELSNNRLRTVDWILHNLKEWYNSLKLTLDGNQLTSAFVGNSRITVYSADFSRNRIGAVRVEDTSRLTGAVYLNLSHNDIGLLEQECFGGFVSLEYLDLSDNPLTSLNRTLQNLPKLYRVDISSCFLETLTQEEFAGCQRIKSVNLRNNSLSDVHGAFRNMKYISILDISFNNLTTLTADSFPPFQKISIRVRVLHMANNSWHCDCRLAWFADWVRRKGSRLMDEPVCYTPAHLQGLPLRMLNRTDFEAWREDCPDGCECLCRAEGLRTYTEVQCLRQGLTEVPKVLPPNARTLDLRGNAIESFRGRDVLRLEQLERLNLENNRIKEVQPILPPKLTSLRLAYNSLRTFPTGDWVANVSITLSRNPWTCNCDTWAFKNWLIQHNDSVVDLQEVRCGNQESFSLRNKPIIILTRKDLCSYVFSIIIISGCCVVLLILCLICICYRQSVSAYLFSWGCRCLKKSQSQDYPYDAFLMYSDDDENLALGEIASGLESGKKPFLLCIPTRDIPSPRTSQKISAYLAQCAKVIVLLTRNFTESTECMQLLISAMSFSIESSSKSILFIMHEDLPPISELDPALKTLLNSCTCLRWGQCLFWKKLIYNLPKKQSVFKKYDDTGDREPLIQ